MRVKGFTLLEILIVMAMLGVLAAIGFPALASYQRSTIMREVSNNIAQVLQDSSARAVADSAAQTVTFTLNSAAGTDLTMTAGGVSRTLTLDRDAKLTSVKEGTTDVTSVIFDVRGRPNNAAAIAINVAFEDRTASVRLLATGKTVVR